MSQRIKTIQAQQAELGRLRTGTSTPLRPGSDRRRPVRSGTWILSSHNRGYVEAAAKLWGGDVEPWQPQNSSIRQWRVTTETDSLDALLPPGDPLSAHNELWDGGGIKLRCDGITELRSGQPCICLARFGIDFHNTAPFGEACKPTTRLRVFLPDMPDFGIWRAETHSFYAAAGLAGQVDAVLEGTGGRGIVPIRLTIEQRQVVREGKPKKFPVVMVIPQLPKLRHALNGPLSATAALDPASLERVAIEAAERPDYRAKAAALLTTDDVTDLWYEARDKGHLDRETKDILIARAAAINAEANQDDGDDEDEPIDAEIVDEQHPAPIWPTVARIPGAPDREDTP
ncbi:hypothetical protein B4N89_27330 [Embleya scabrispora]|uniref:Uncharacterized protein n=1 Tax=Embleya scabrispora TaxID=159449 RepID=A0A1T3P520_9ACTN|nr:hypothetical protein [Embleya scabrispora]OPC84144.1 hypothetical protein B4N89_27330 [Embleya scabrispora]